MHPRCPAPFAGARETSIAASRAVCEKGWERFGIRKETFWCDLCFFFKDVLFNFRAVCFLLLSRRWVLSCSVASHVDFLEGMRFWPISVFFDAVHDDNHPVAVHVNQRWMDPLYDPMQWINGKSTSLGSHFCGLKQVWWSSPSARTQVKATQPGVCVQDLWQSSVDHHGGPGPNYDGKMWENVAEPNCRISFKNLLRSTWLIEKKNTKKRSESICLGLFLVVVIKIG